MDNEVDTQEPNESNNRGANAKEAKASRRAQNDANNAQAIKVASNALAGKGGVVGAVAAGIKAGDAMGLDISGKVGKAVTIGNQLTGPAGRRMQRQINSASKLANSGAGRMAMNYAMKKNGGSGSRTNTNSAAAKNKNNSSTPKKGDNNTTIGSVDKNAESSGEQKSGEATNSYEAVGKIKKPSPIIIIPLAIIILVVIIGLFIYAAIVTAIDSITPGILKPYHGSDNGSVTINNVSGLGSYYSNNSENANSLNNYSVVYVKETGENVTYQLNEFLTGVVYGMTGDNYSEELYKVYTILIKTNILIDDDGVIESSQYHFVDVSNSYTLNNIKSAISNTENELLLDSNYRLIETDFHNNNCEECDISEGINLNSIAILINENKNYVEVIEEIYGEDAVVNDVNPIISIDLDIDITVKDTSSGEYLRTPINDFLTSKGSSLEHLNAFIKDNVSPKYGTKEGVAIAAVSLINYLHDGFNTRLPYYWGGKMYPMQEGISREFGGRGYSSSPKGNVYTVKSFDCSGFVQWAIYNGGFKDPSTGTSYFATAFPDKCLITNESCVGKVGDIINWRTFPDANGKSGGHVQLIVAVDTSNRIYYIAESSTNGVVVTTVGMHKGRTDANVYVHHMASYYAKNVR